MATAETVAETSFSDFPEDVQLNILSFLSPSEISSFACTSRRSSTLCAGESLWLSLLDRRWGRRSPARRWASSASSLPRLYRLLDRWDSLAGFWRRIGGGAPPLVFFEWGPSSLTCSDVSPDTTAAAAAADGYAVLKTPFLWLGLSPLGEPACFRLDSDSDLDPTGSDLDYLIPVTVSFTGPNHFVVEESRRASPESLDDEAAEIARSGVESTSPPNQLVSEIYQYFANRTSPGSGDRAWRRQRKRRERERLDRKQRRAEHFVRIPDCHSTPSRPLQGLWKVQNNRYSSSFVLLMLVLNFKDLQVSQNANVGNRVFVKILNWSSSL